MVCWCCGGEGTRFSMVFLEDAPCAVCHEQEYQAWLSGPHMCRLCMGSGHINQSLCYGCDGTGMFPPTLTAPVDTEPSACLHTQ